MIGSVPARARLRAWPLRLGLALCAAAPAAHAQPAAPAVHASSAAPPAAPGAAEVRPGLTARARLLGDPGGWRSRLEDRGVDLQLFANQYLTWKPRGGADDRSRWGASGSADFYAWVDAEELAGARGLVGLVHLKGQYDRNVNGDVGALADPIDDADLDEALYVSQLWLQQDLLGEALRLRAGFLAQQVLYDRNAFANSEDRQFLNTALDNNPLVPLPDALGAAFLVRPSGWLEIAAGVADADNPARSGGFDTAFDGADSLNAYLELAFDVRLGRGPRALPGRYRVGAFRDGRERTVVTDASTGSTRRERGHPGAWLSFDQLAFREAGDPEQGLGVFGRAGWADPDASPASWFWSAGLQYTGALPGRGRDVLGLAAYQLRGSDAFRRTPGGRLGRETGVELYYAVQVFPWLVVTPDVQLVLDPGARGAPDAVVTTLRLRVGF